MNCKPGDMAIIIKQPHAGMIVEVLRAGQGYVDYKSGWIVRLPRVMPLQVTYPGRATDQYERHDEAFVPDAYLRPISGIPDADTETTDQPEEIAA